MDRFAASMFRCLDDSPVTLAPLLSRRLPQHRLYSERQRGEFRGSLGGSEKASRSSPRHWIRFFLLAGLIPDSPHLPSFRTPPGVLLYVAAHCVRPLYGPRKEETPLSGRRLDALSLRLLRVFGVRHDEMMRRLVRCRRWKPMLRGRRRWWSILCFITSENEFLIYPRRLFVGTPFRMPEALFFLIFFNSDFVCTFHLKFTFGLFRAVDHC